MATETQSEEAAANEKALLNRRMGALARCEGYPRKSAHSRLAGSWQRT
jgi:hypothetical protein